MNIAIIDVCWKTINPANPFEVPQGGSETWLIQIAREFAKDNNIDLYMSSSQNTPYKENDTLTYYNFDDFVTNGKIYDFVILNRFFKKKNINYVSYIKAHKRARHVYIQVHDLSLLKEISYNLLGLMQNADVEDSCLNDDFVTIVTLNEWHKKNLLSQYPKLKTEVICIPNGLDLSLFPARHHVRDNRILWSSCMDRGLNILINDIYPLVKKEIPDFGIDVARYNDDFKLEDTDKDVKLVGKLSKEELYDEQSKHKVWFYPGTFAETFCITMIENVMNGVQIVSPLTYGMNPTIGYADDIRMQYNFKSDYSSAVHEAADKIIEILKNDYETPVIYDKIKNKIRIEYNWKNSVNLYLTHYKSNNYKIKTSKSADKKILFLTMSCNIPYFKALASVVKDTWAAPLIRGDYKNCTWLMYTACDRKHPYPVIDWKEHMVYVDCSDEVYHTYEKTQKAYKMIADAGIDFDYIVRTNTSVYVNVKSVINKVNTMTDNDILGVVCGYYHCFPDGHREFQWNIIPGLFFGMCRRYFEMSLTGTNNDDVIPATDDVILSKRLFEQVPFESINFIEPNQGVFKEYPRYKARMRDDERPEWNEQNKTYIDDPYIINRCSVVQLRPLYGDLTERAEKGHEFEHFYEIDAAIN